MKKNKNGFTLVEVIVAMAAFAVMALLVCTLYAFLNRMVYKSNSMNTHVDSQVADYEKAEGARDTISGQHIIFGQGTSYETDVIVEYKVIKNSTPDPDSNPDIKYFYKP